MPVRAHADWLSQTDERVLELLDAEGPLRRPEIRDRLAAVSPGLAMSRAAVDARCAALRERGLVASRDDAVALTATGSGFLDGSVDLSASNRADGLSDSGTGSRERPRVDADGSADDYWVCPDCRWIGERRDLERDESGDDVCPVCRNASEYID
jgi:hypothetical protein